MGRYNIDDVNFNLNGKFDNFYEKVHTTVIQHAPLRKFNKKQLKLRAKPRVNPHLQKTDQLQRKTFTQIKKIALQEYRGIVQEI